MIYDWLPQTYWETQIARVDALVAKINGNGAVTLGRVIPEDDDLAIGEGRQLQLAVMFLDISGFSRRRSVTASEQGTMLRVLNLFFTEMIKIAEDYGGYVEKNTGDGLMAYFENDGQESAAKRALTSAMTMMAANDTLIRPRLVNGGIDPILFRVSIDYGLVTVARLGAAKRFNANVAIGTTANFASKMLAKAKAGDVVLGASAYAQIPVDWRNQFSVLAVEDTGWTTVSNQPYLLYKFTGRWAKTI
jgi:adenylate cyclase